MTSSDVVNIKNKTPEKMKELLFMIDAKDMVYSIDHMLAKNDINIYKELYETVMVNYSINRVIEYLYTVTNSSDFDNERIKTIALDYLNELMKLMYDYEMLPSYISFV